MPLRITGVVVNTKTVMSLKDYRYQKYGNLKKKKKAEEGRVWERMWDLPKATELLCEEAEPVLSSSHHKASKCRRKTVYWDVS